MKSIALSFVAAALMMFTTGCKYVAPVFQPDPFSVTELVKAHPKLQKVCDLAGGCDKVDVYCDKYDNSGNSEIRGMVFWEIFVHFDHLGQVGSVEYTKPGLTAPMVLDAAIDEWLNNYQKELYEYTASQNKAADKEIMPKHLSCDKDCIK